MATNAKKIGNIIKKVLWGIMWTILGLLIVVLGWLAIDKFIIKSPVPSIFGYAWLTIETGSMNGYSAMVEGDEPKQVNIGDMIIIKDTGDYKIGDVITFLPEGDKIPTTHRIIGYTEDGYVTKGDANNTHDTVPISRDRVLGEVVAHLPKVGLFASWVQKEGWLYIVTLLAIVGLGAFLIKGHDDDEGEDEDTETEHTDNADDTAEDTKVVSTDTNAVETDGVNANDVPHSTDSIETPCNADSNVDDVSANDKTTNNA